MNCSDENQAEPTQEIRDIADKLKQRFEKLQRINRVRRILLAKRHVRMLVRELLKLSDKNVAIFVHSNALSKLSEILNEVPLAEETITTLDFRTLEGLSQLSDENKKILIITDEETCEFNDVKMLTYHSIIKEHSDIILDIFQDDGELKYKWLKF